MLVRRKCCRYIITNGVILASIGLVWQFYLILSPAVRQVPFGISVDRFKAEGSHLIAEQEPKDKKYNLLINSYMNSGSRFTGRMFGFRDDSFYFYEPLWLFSIWDYYHVPNLVCSSTNRPVSCRVGTVSSVNTIRERGRPKTLVTHVNSSTSPVGMMVDILRDIYNCNFTRFENLIVTEVQGNTVFAGPSWNDYRSCLRSRVPRSTCIRRQEKRCRSASHVVTKVLRLTTVALDSLLATNDNLKVIQLFRDPRAIVNSRSESSGYPGKDTNSNSQVLCRKMLIDFKGGEILEKKYPNRFRFVFYEDIKSNVPYKIDKLYKFLGMDQRNSTIDNMNKVIPNQSKRRFVGMTTSRRLDNANWWRKNMMFANYKQVQNNCREVGQHFNLTHFHAPLDLGNVSISAMNLAKRFMIN